MAIPAVAGAIILADDPNQLANAWTAYTPVWSSNGTAVSLGNGTITGKYIQFGKLVVCRATLKMGSTTTFGTGDYFITVPVAAAATSLRAIGAAYMLDSGTANKEGIAFLSTTTLMAFASSAATVGATSPHTWAVNDEISFTHTYEAA